MPAQDAVAGRENDARKFVTDMVAAISADDPPIIHRESETDKIFQILSRKNKKGVALVGQRGVGKRAVVQSLARRVAVDDVPPALLGPGGDRGRCQVLALNQRGYKADYIDLLLADIKRSRRNVILFIDNVHILFQRLGVDAFGILEDIVSREYVSCIVATRPEEYYKHFEDDSGGRLEALQGVFIREPAVTEVCEILKVHRYRYEAHHSVKISDGAIIAAVELAKQHTSSRALPGYSLDLIDEAGSTVPRLAQHADNSSSVRGIVTDESVRRVLQRRLRGESPPPAYNEEQLDTGQADQADQEVGRDRRIGIHPDNIVDSNNGSRAADNSRGPHNAPSQVTNVDSSQRSSIINDDASGQNMSSQSKTKLKGLSRLFHRKKGSKSLETATPNPSPQATEAGGGPKTTSSNAASIPPAASAKPLNTTAKDSSDRTSRTTPVGERIEDRRAEASLAQRVTSQYHNRAEEKEAIKLLKANGFDPKSQKSFRANEALNWAAGNGNDTAVEYLLRTFGRKLGDWDRRTCIGFAAEHGHISIVKIILDHGTVNLASRDTFGSTVLHRVVSLGGAHADIIKLVLERGGADLVAQPTLAGRTVLHTAASSGHVETMLLLMDYGASIHDVDNSGFSPLHLAARGGHLEVVKTLLAHGADIEVKSTKNLTPLFGAAENGNTDVVAFLLENGASVRVRETEREHSPLHLAVKNGYAKTARLLIESGARPYAKDRTGNTAVDMARTYWNREPFEQFVEFIKQQKKKKQTDPDESEAGQDSETQVGPETELPYHPQLRQRPADLEDWSKYERDNKMVDPMIMRWS